MEQSDRLGKSVMLGYPYDDAIRNLAEIWRNTAELSEMSLGQDDMSAIDWLLAESHGVFYVIGERSAAELLLKGLSEGNHLETVSRSLLEIRENPRVRFIKFENVCKRPVQTYLKFFASMGITDDPYYIPEIVEEQLVRKIQEVSPHAFSDELLENMDPDVRYQLWKKTPGAWKEMFTPEIKQYFKRHDNGILKAFGYERDDEW